MVLFYRLMLVLIFVTPIWTFAQSNPGSNSEQHLSDNYKQLDTLFKRLVNHDKLYGSFAVIDKGEIRHRRSFGYARKDREDTIKASENTRYYIASVTKPYTATLVMKLVEEGKLSLDDKLAEFYPEFPNAASITIRHLLGHKSGLYNYTDSDWSSNWGSKPWRKQKILQYIQAKEPDFEPGEQFSYSNTNYLLLGYIVEDLTGKHYGQVLKEKITAPLGLENTYFAGPTRIFPEAQGFRQVNGKWQSHAQIDRSRLYFPSNHGAGAVVSTPDELLRFVEALTQGEVISQESFEQMTPEEQGYGLGMPKGINGSDVVYSHSGAAGGFYAFYGYYPEDSFGYALTSNALSYDSYTLNQKIGKILRGIKTDMPNFYQETTDLEKAYLRELEGLYASDKTPKDVKIFQTGDHLLYRSVGGRPYWLQAVNDTLFINEELSLEIKFNNPKTTAPLAFHYQRRGKDWVFEKQEDLSYEEQEYAKLNKAQLKELAGNYQSQKLPNDLSIRYKKEQLIARYGDQPEFPLKALNDSTFTNEPLDLTLQFERSEDEAKQIDYQIGGQSFMFEKRGKDSDGT